MKYSLDLTLNHIESKDKPSCLRDFNTLIFKEGFDEGFDVFDTETKVLDLDCVEATNAQRQGRTNNCSMDCAFAVNTDPSQMILVELRFNYVNMQNLNRKKLIDKVNDSTLALGSTVKIHDKYFFVFKKSLTEQAKNRIQRMLPRVPSSYIVCDIHELKTIFFE